MTKEQVLNEIKKLLTDNGFGLKVVPNYLIEIYEDKKDSGAGDKKEEPTPEVTE
jgi:hypothetical protein